MPTIAGASLLASARQGLISQYEDEISALVRSLQGLVISAGTLPVTRDKQSVFTIPRSSERRVLQQAGDTVQRFFVGSDFRSAYADDGVTPLAPFPQMLNYWLAWVTVGVIQKHSAYLQKHLPADIQAWLRTRDVGQEMFTFVGELALPKPVYEAAHTWVDPRGYRLSDRIWQASIETRKKVDALLADAIRSGRDVRQVARELEQFLLPSRAGVRTNKPYGRSASYDAMRLIRSELSRAHAQVTVAASMANPFVDGVDWHLSAAHPKVDMCDRIATVGMSGQRLKPPYPLDGNVPIPVQNSHPQCICFTTSAVLSANVDTIQKLRAMMDAGEEPPVTVIDVWGYLRRLIGAFLAALVFREVTQQ